MASAVVRRAELGIENRVGITGWSWGGYFTIRGLLLEPSIYRVGVAVSPVAEAYEDYDHEFYLGQPADNKAGYDYASNLRLAGELKGRLLIMHGTSDREVPFSQTMMMVDALIRAGRPHDLTVLPDQPHQVWYENSEFIQETTVEYFRKHLSP